MVYGHRDHEVCCRMVFGHDDCQIFRRMVYGYRKTQMHVVVWCHRKSHSAIDSGHHSRHNHETWPSTMVIVISQPAVVQSPIITITKSAVKWSVVTMSAMEWLTAITTPNLLYHSLRS